MKRKNLLTVIFVSLITLLFIAGGVYLRSEEQLTTIVQKKGEEAGEHLHDEEEAHDEHLHDEMEEHDEHLHDDHEEPAEHLHDEEEENLVRLTDEEMKNIGVGIATAGSGRLKVDLRFPAEILVNADHMANVAARLSGIVRNVKKNLGDFAKKGEVLAVIESRDLSDARSSLHAAHGRFDLAQSNYSREERLWEKKITSQQDY